MCLRVICSQSDMTRVDGLTATTLYLVQSAGSVLLPSRRLSEVDLFLWSLTANEGLEDLSRKGWVGSYRPERAVASRESLRGRPRSTESLARAVWCVDTAVIHLPMQRTARQLSSRNAAHNTPPCPNQRHVSGVGSACRLHGLRAQWSSTWPCSSTAPARLHQLVTWRQRLVVAVGGTDRALPWSNSSPI